MAFPALVLSLLGAAYVSVEQPSLLSTTDEGIRVKGGRLVESDGSSLVLRGVNHGHAFGPGPPSVYEDMKSAGANAVRVSLSSGHHWPATSASEIRRVVERCKDNRLICVFDVHDTVGYGQDPDAASMSAAVDYWLRVQSALKGEEAFTIVNIANEPTGYGIVDSWVAETQDAIRRLRAAGFRHTLMVDAPNWGNDEFHTMRDNAQAVFDADPDRNTVFDIHMYGPFDSMQKVSDYLSAFVARKLPIVVGEFSDMHEYGDPDEDSIMAYCQDHDLGYFGWSWSGNSVEYAYLDMVTDFNPAARTRWGNRFIDGPNGLRATSREASVYGGLWKLIRR